MDKETKQELIYESFDVLKDSWEDKYEAIERLIYQMFLIDKKVAIDMWLYILRKNEDDFNDSEPYYKASMLTNRVIGAIVYGPNCGVLFLNYNNPNEIALAEMIFKNQELYNYIFGKKLSTRDETSHILSHLIASDDSQTLFIILKLISESKKEKTIGEILTKAIEHISGVQVPQNQIELLENFVSTIEDKTERAEAFTALLSIENY